MKEVFMGKKKEVGALQVGMYGMGNFAAQLSWTMVSTYLAVFYTDVVGLAPAAVSLLMLVAKVWDGINDPMMGAIMQKTNTKYGKFRPYIVVGALVLIVFTVLTFSVPGFSTPGKLVWAYVTYIGLGMSYTVENVPFNALPSRMTRNPEKINSLFASSLTGGAVGSMLLMNITLPIIMVLGHGDQAKGYQKVAILYSVVAAFLTILATHFCKENVEDTEDAERTTKIPLRESFKAIFVNRNLMKLFIFTLLQMTAVMGRVGVMFYFYMYCVGNPMLIGILMTIPSVSGIGCMILAPAVMKKFGRKAILILGAVLGGVGLAMMFFGPYTNIPWMIVSSVIYGAYSIGMPGTGGMIVDAIDEYDLKTGVRTDGLAFAVNGLMNKVGGGIGSAIGLALLGAYGYRQGVEITPHIVSGINLGTNLIPMILSFVSVIPILLYNLTEEKMAGIRRELEKRNSLSE